jgi:hypothetical protein
MLRGMASEEVPHAPAPERARDTRALGRALIDGFGTGWARANVDQIMAVFASDAVFVETPITFSSGEIFAAGPWFSTEFKCVFRRKRTGEWIDARGAIFCETDGTLITEMRVYWHRWNGGRETSKP